jgi:hypothetical protein
MIAIKRYLGDVHSRVLAHDLIHVTHITDAQAKVILGDDMPMIRNKVGYSLTDRTILTRWDGQWTIMRHTDMESIEQPGDKPGDWTQIGYFEGSYYVTGCRSGELFALDQYATICRAYAAYWGVLMRGDTMDYTAELRKVATKGGFDFFMLFNHWHGGQFSAFYKAACNGRILDRDHAWDCRQEAKHCLKTMGDRFPEDRPAMQALFDTLDALWDADTVNQEGE